MKLLILSMCIIGAIAIFSVIKSRSKLTKISFWIVITVLSGVEVLLILSMIFMLFIGYNS